MEAVREKVIPFLTVTKFMAEAPIKNDRLTTEKHIYFIQVLGDMVAFRNDLKKHVSVFMLSLVKSGQSCRSMVEEKECDLVVIN
jgi:hypothetical protein